MTRWTIASLAATAALLIQMPLPAEPPAAAPPVAGWRGNYTGTFPDSRPPTRWRKVSKVVAALRCRAAKPENEGPAGVSAANGAFTEWMVLGPLNSGVTTDKEAIGKAFVEDEASWRPDGREVVRDRTWRRVTTPGTVLDFTAVFAGEVPHPKPAWDHQVVFKAPHVAYACTYVHSPERVTLHYATRWGGQCRMWVNDRPLSQSALTDREHLELKKLTLEKGWNRVLYKAANTPSSQKPERGRNPWSFWFAELEVRGVRPREERVENILWQTPTPYYHLACPLIVGDRVFVMAKPADLICLDKKSGRIRWIRSTTYYNLMGDEARKSNPSLRGVPPLLEKLEALNARYVRQNGLDHKAMRARQSLLRQIWKTIAQVDPSKYGRSLGHYPKGAMPTPVSDGRRVYIWTEGGIASCFDLEGNRKWTAMPGTRHGGRYQSPIVSAGRMIFFEDGHLYGLAKDTGEVAWKTPTHGTAQSPVPFPCRGKPYVYFNDTLFDATDGRIVWTGSPQTRNNITTAVVAGADIYNIATKRAVSTGPDGALRATQRTLWDTAKRKLPKPQSFIPSPLYHDGLLYAVDVDGILYVSDAEKGGLVYMKDLGMGKEYYYDYYLHPFGRVHASLVMAGGRIYVWGLTGVTVVFEPGRTYKELARNMIEGTTGVNGRRGWRMIPENFGSTPVVDGDRIYVRGSTHVYCIGQTP